MNEIKEYTKDLFENIKHIDKDGNEYWEARELQKVLEYKEWRNFNKVLDKAMKACSLSKFKEKEQFVEFNKLIKGGNGNIQNVKDYKLSRYACYLIVQNGDPSKRNNSIRSNLFCYSN